MENKKKNLYHSSTFGFSEANKKRQSRYWKKLVAPPPPPFNCTSASFSFPFHFSTVINNRRSQGEGGLREAEPRSCQSQRCGTCTAIQIRGGKVYGK